MRRDAKPRRGSVSYTLGSRRDARYPAGVFPLPHRSPVGRILLVAAAYAAVTAAVVLPPEPSQALASPARDRLARGAAVWREGNCAACHALFGLGGHLGPDLTNVLGLRGDTYVRATVTSGRPGMPAYPLASDALDDLQSYLGRVDASGRYPLPLRPLRVFGHTP